jgi:TolB protein
MSASSGPAQQPPPLRENGAHPVASPDGRHIVFVSDRDGTSDLYVMRDDGSEVTRITNSAAHEGIAGWSRDGSRLIYSTMAGDTATLFSVPIAGGSAERIGRVVGQGSRVTPDGSRAIYGEMPWQTMQLYAVNVDGSSPQRLTPGTSAFYCSAISRDGREIATSRSDAGALQVWLIGIDGSALRQLTHFSPTDGNAQCPSWSPDGRRLAVQSDVFDRQDPKRSTSYIWVIDIASGAATKLDDHTMPHVDEVPSWLADGKRIAFQSSRTGRWEIWIMNSDGTGVHQLTR